MRSVTKSLVWLTIFIAVSVVCTLIVLTALRSPVTGASFPVYRVVLGCVGALRR